MSGKIIGRTGDGVIVPITRLGAGHVPVPEGMVAQVSATEPLPVPWDAPVPVAYHRPTTMDTTAAPSWMAILLGLSFLLPQLLLLALVLYWQAVPPR